MKDSQIDFTASSQNEEFCAIALIQGSIETTGSVITFQGGVEGMTQT